MTDETETTDDYLCRSCHCAMHVPDGLDPLEPGVRYCPSCAADEIERLRAELDEARISEVRTDYLESVGLVSRWAAGNPNLADRVRAVVAIVDRLPKFRDGVVAEPGMNGVARHGSGWKKVTVQHYEMVAYDVDMMLTRVSECYSSREAAEKARSV